MSNSETPRFERKFRIENGSLEEILLRIWSLPQAFRPIYQPRLINNIYYDTPDLDCYQDNVTGAGTRRKYRLRWYDQLRDQAVVELKKRLDGVGTKIRLQTLPEGLIPVVINRYRREYFLSFDGRFRLTVDSGVEYARYQDQSWIPDPAIILEVKYNPEADMDFGELACALPYRLTKNSKYVQAVERCWQ